MNFFIAQDRARRKTFLLVLYFVTAVALIILAVNAAVYFIMRYAPDSTVAAHAWLEQPYWIWITAGTIIVILFGTVRDLIRLGGGGRAVADLVGARRINASTTDPEERKLVNVVEEMSIASGTPRPQLYVMDGETAINAFVAGYRPTEAVLVVTKGALQKLSRDELQGVIGHEYSHILNGDMRLNIRLWAILSGILLIGQIGHFMLRSLRHSGRSSGRGRGQGTGVILMLGLALFVIGYIGLFFGRLIKAAVSRQREFLADASSVQFTRNPDGIAGALWRIREDAGGSVLMNEHAEDMSHLCFGSSMHFFLDSLFATHPPLAQRIRAVSPGFQARQRQRSAVTTAGAQSTSPMPAAGLAATPAQIATSVGTVSPAQLEHAGAVHASMPAAVLESLHDGAGAREVIYGLILAATPDKSAQEVTGAVISGHAGAGSLENARRHARVISELGPGVRLPIINMAMPELQILEGEVRQEFLEVVTAAVQADRRFSLFEFVLVRLLQDHLADAAVGAHPARYFKYQHVLEELRLVFTLLARAGADDSEQAVKTFRHVMGMFTKAMTAPAPDSACTVRNLGVALTKLAALSPLLKQSVITACADCVLHDNKVQPAEAEMLQAVAVTLDCPLPPLVA